jgi:hypothetical protein
MRAYTTRVDVARVLSAKLSIGDVRLQIRDMARNRGRALVNTHILHFCAHNDHLSLLELLIGKKNIQGIIDRQLGKHDYTALEIAAYRGSLSMIRYLITQGANVMFINSHGENIQQCIDTGEYAAISHRPADTMFTRYRFEQCRRFLLNREQYVNAQIGRDLSFTPRVPRTLYNAGVKILNWWRYRQHRVRAPV